nr:Hint domain-containing protein [Methylorubrum zatmanii]
MAIFTTNFAIYPDSSAVPFASGQIQVDDSTNIVVGISGMIDGRTITGLSNYNGADNVLVSVPIFTRSYNYYVNNAGLGIAAGDVSYNISGTPPQPGRTRTIFDTIVGSDGSNRLSGFSASAPTIICFVTGTMIATARGEVAVEDLRAGDFTRTAEGGLRPIVWIGHREIVSDAGSVSFSQQPVRVRTGAFGSNLPARDLYLSPGHPVLVGASADNEGGTLVPIMCLINGTTIAREPRTSVTYWHVELDAHDILLAEGLPAESYLDLGSRTWFAGADGPLVDPDTAFVEAPGRCRPVATDGPLVVAERMRLDAVFADSLAEQCGWPASELSF